MTKKLAGDSESAHAAREINRAVKNTAVQTFVIFESHLLKDDASIRLTRRNSVRLPRVLEE